MKIRTLFQAVGSLLLLSVINQATLAQEVKAMVSPYAEVLQRINVTDVKITYHRPGVKGREIWGKLVPFGGDKPWRAGANDATTFSINKPVKIEGKELPAGNYTFYAFIGKDEWTLVFNKVAKTWGSYDYDAKQDALRVTVKPMEAPMKERLAYGFEDLQDKSAVCCLHWEKLKVSFKIEVE
jgi:hypothetical protein